MQPLAHTNASHRFFQPAVSLPREHLAAIQHIINDALALQARALRQPPPPYTNNNNTHNTRDHDSSPWFKPRMDLYESTSVSGARPLVTATFELPGLRKEDVHISVLDNYMIVAGDRCHLSAQTRDSDEEMKDVEAVNTKDDPNFEPVSITSTQAQDQELGAQGRAREGYTIREIKRGRFKRVVPLPAGTKLEDVKASMHDGILTVTFPGSVRPVLHSIPVA